MSLTERIAVIIDSVHQGAVRGLNQTGTAAGGLATKSKTANLALALLNRTGLASTTMGKKLTAGINESGTAMGGLKASGVSTGQMLGGALAGGALAASAALASIAIKGVAKFEEATAQVRGLQRVIGGTAEDSSKLRFVAQALGVDIGTVGKGFGILEKTIGLGTNKLGQYGIEVVRTKDGNVSMAQTLVNIAHAYQATDDPAKKAAIRFAAFGKSGNDLIPILSKSDAELKQLYKTADDQHQIFSSSDLEQGRQLSAATRQLNSAITGLEIELAKGLVPALTDATTGITDSIQAADNATQSIGGLGTVFKVLAEAVSGPIVHGLKTFGELFQGHFVDSIKEGIHAIPAIGPVIQGLTGWLDTGSGSSKKAADAAAAHTVAEQDRATAMETTATAAVAEQQGIQSLIDTELAAESSQRQLTDATNTYQTALWEATKAGGKNTDANKKLDDATFALKEQINQTAQAVAKDAVAHSTLTDKAALARLGNDAYRVSLAKAASSEIPAVRGQALLLIAALDQASQPRNVKITVDTYQAHNALNDLRTKWDSLQNAMGLIGPSRT